MKDDTYLVGYSFYLHNDTEIKKKKWQEKRLKDL